MFEKETRNILKKADVLTNKLQLEISNFVQQELDDVRWHFIVKIMDSDVVVKIFKKQDFENTDNKFRPCIYRISHGLKLLEYGSYFNLRPEMYSVMTRCYKFLNHKTND